MDRRRQRAFFAAIFSIFFITLIVFVWSLQAGPLPILVEGASSARWRCWRCEGGD